MAELFMKLFSTPDQVDLKGVTQQRGYLPGDIVEVLEDGAGWGTLDLVEPTGVILRVPEISMSEAKIYLLEDRDPNDAENGDVHLRINKVDVDKFPANLQTRLSTRAKIAATDYVDMTALEIRSYKTERDPVRVLVV